jgi:hypothetical protein
MTNVSSFSPNSILSLRQFHQTFFAKDKDAGEKFALQFHQQSPPKPQSQI